MALPSFSSKLACPSPPPPSPRVSPSAHSLSWPFGFYLDLRLNLMMSFLAMNVPTRHWPKSKVHLRCRRCHGCHSILTLTPLPFRFLVLLYLLLVQPFCPPSCFPFDFADWDDKIWSVWSDPRVLPIWVNPQFPFGRSLTSALGNSLQWVFPGDNCKTRHEHEGRTPSWGWPAPKGRAEDEPGERMRGIGVGRAALKKCHVGFQKPDFWLQK